MTMPGISPDRTGIQQLLLPGAEQWTGERQVMMNLRNAAPSSPTPGSDGAAFLGQSMADQLVLFAGPPWP